MFDIKTTQGYFLHLIKSALRDEMPNEKPNEVDWRDVYEIAFIQNAANLAWFSIGKLSGKPEGELYAQWELTYARAASKCMKQMMETDLLAQAFTEAGYDIMFLKGSEINSYYPSPDMRTMTDIDLLVRADDREPVRELMKSLGYEVDLLDDGQVDAFKKYPVIYTEVHYDFSYEKHAYHDMFHIEWDKLVESDVPHIYKMTFEDLYYFNIGHYAKNMHNRGMGIRAILDCYVLWNAASEEQKENILMRFKNTELEEFNENLLKIMNIWFDDAMDDGSLQNVQRYLLETGTYGSIKKENTLYLIDNPENTQSKSNLKFVFSKVFPSADELFDRFHIEKRRIILLPYLWFKRIILLIFSSSAKKEKVKQDYQMYKEISVDEVKYEIEIRKEFGLIKRNE